jgi:hypothetical protein
MLLVTFDFLYRAQKQAILDPVKGHSTAEGSDAMGILLRITTLLENLKPDTAASHTLEPHQVLERNGEVPPTLGILGGKSATNKDGR